MAKKMREIFQKTEKFKNYKFFDKVKGYLMDLRKKGNWKPENYSWNNVAVLLANIMALYVYCDVSPAIAEYQGKKIVYYAAKVIIVVMGLITIGEIEHLIKCRGYDYLCVVEKFSQHFQKGRLSKKLSVFCQVSAIIIGFLYLCSFNHSTVECYDSVVEVYGIPKGVGEPLTKEEQDRCAGYWEIEKFKLQKRIVLTYVEPYEQLELMCQNSTVYGMTLFHPSSKIVYEYKKDKDYYFLQDQNAVEEGEKEDFWVAERISYYSSSEKLLLRLERNEQNRLEIVAYSSEDMPQLLNSTLLRVPDDRKIENGILSQQIEITYNSDGLPQMIRFSSHINNPYGVNGECYVYDQKKRLAALYYINSAGEAICNQVGIMRITFQYNDRNNVEWINYYNDENGTQKVEGYYGVCCENLEYNDNGNLEVRKQLDRSGLCWYDKNGVSIYKYDYKEGSGKLEKETFLDRSWSPIRDKNNHCFGIEFGQQKKNGSREISVLFAQRDNSEKKEDALSVEGLYDSGEMDVETFSSGNLQGKEVDGMNDIQVEEIANGSNSSYSRIERGDSFYDFNNELDDESDLARSYTTIRYTVGEHNHIKEVSYYDEDGKLAINEEKYARKRYEYDAQHRIIGETYLNKLGQICLVHGGYAKIRYIYDPKLGSELKRVEYLDMHSKLTFNSELGYAYIEYDSQFQGMQKKVTQRYYDSSKKLMLLPDLGYAVMEQVYDENGLLIQEMYRDESDISVCREDYKVAEIFYDYAEDGNLICTQYKDIQGHPANRTDKGYASVYQKYENGQLQERWYEGYQNDRFQAVPDRTTGYAKVKYIYDNGRMAKEQYFNVENTPVLRSDMGCALLTYEYNDKGQLAAKYFYDTEGNLTLRSDTGYAVIKFEYDDTGRCTSERFYGTEKEDSVISTKYHCAGFRYNYEESGNRKDTWYLGLDGEKMVRKDLGFAHVRSEYDKFGNEEKVSYYNEKEELVERREGGYAWYKNNYNYDENGNLEEICYYDAEDHLVMRNDQGYASVEYHYDEYNRNTTVIYKDTEGNPVINTEYHCAGFVYEYDKNGNRTETCYIGLDKKPMFRKDYGFVRIQRENDKNVERVLYLDKEKNAAVWREGGFSVYEDIYENKSLIEERYLDQNKRLVMRDDTGFAIEKYQYDAYGKCISRRYYDTKRNPVISTKYHCAGFEYEYDDAGNQTDIWYLGLDGEPMIREDLGYAHIQYVYDNVGNKEKELYYDIEANPVISTKYHCAGFEYEYDDAGNQTDIWYLNLNGKVMVREDLGYAHIQYKYDDLGNKVSKRYYDENDELTIGKEDYCAGFKYAYNVNGNRTNTWYLGLDGEIINRRDLGYAHIYSEYDDFGNEVKICYFDKHEKLTDGKKDGYSYCEKHYANGNLVESRYYDAKGRLVLQNDEGYAVIKMKYDEYGQCTSEFYYGTDEELVINTKYHCAGFGYKYDERGNESYICYYGLDGKLAEHKDYGAAYLEEYYDSYNHYIGEAYFDLGRNKVIRKDLGYAAVVNIYEGTYWMGTKYLDVYGEPIMNKEEGFAILRCKYDSDGRLASQTYYDAEDRPVNIADGYARVEWIYDSWGNIVKCNYFDQSDVEEK